MTHLLYRGLSPENAVMNYGRYILNAFVTTIFQPFCDDCSNSVEIEHHNIVLLISWIMKSVQYGIEDIVK